MRIRITQSRNGSIDGVDLAAFRAGRTYDVQSSIGHYLVGTASAEEISEQTPSVFLMTHPNEVMVSMMPRLVPDVAADDEYGDYD